MTEDNSPNIHPSLNNELFRLNLKNEVRDYFFGEMKERELLSKRLSIFIPLSDYFEKSLIDLAVRTGTIYIASFETVIVTPVGIASPSVSIAFSTSTGIVKRLLKIMQKKKKKHNKIVMLARRKLNSVESKISEALINNEITHEDFMLIVNEEKKLS